MKDVRFGTAPKEISSILLRKPDVPIINGKLIIQINHELMISLVSLDLDQ